MFAGYDSDGYNIIQTGRPECLFTSLYINNPFEREEVVQQVFIRLWEKRESIDESVDLDGYPFIITRNMIFNRSRRSFNEKAYKEVMEAIGSDSYTLDAPLSYRLSEANGDVSYRMTFPQGMRHGIVFKVSRKIFNRMAPER